MELSREELKEIVRTVLEEDAEMQMKREEGLMKRLTGYVLIMVGIDPNQPDEEIARDLKDFRATIAHSHKWMKSISHVQKVGTAAAVTTIIAGMFGALWMGIADKLRH